VHARVTTDGTPPRPQRRLAAVLAADVVGYSSLMGVDEEATLAALRTHQTELIDPTVVAHSGRLVKTTGDGFLVEFASVVEAVRCAIEWQQGMERRNTGVPPDQRIVFRIGVNLGDVMVEGHDIFGDGVNVAARLEGLARPGTICLSRSARDQVRDKLLLQFQPLGEVKVKNIARPIQAFLMAPQDGTSRVAGFVTSGKTAWRRPVAAATLALVILSGGLVVWFAPWAPSGERVSSQAKGLPLPSKPSIAVLPFVNLGGEAQEVGLGEALAQNIISSLSQSSKMFVIARNSSFSYKGRPVKVQTLSQELGVRYVLEGSLQRSGSQLRITAQLVDATTGYQVWSETFDRGLDDLFALQDEITLRIVTALQIELTQGEVARVRRRGTNNLKAWLLVNQSFDHLVRFTKEGNEQARRLAEEAIALDPKYPEAYVRLGRTHLTDFHSGWVANSVVSLRRSIELAQQALSLDETYPDTYHLLGAIYLFVKRHDDARLAVGKALELSPNHSLAKANLGMILTYSGEPDAAIVQLREAMRLSPVYPDWFLSELGRAYFQAGRHVDAINALTQAVRRNPESGEALVLLAAAMGAAGRQNEARAALSKFLTPRPAYTIRQYSAGEFYKNPADLERVVSALHSAGLRE
jgi:adenylate cyclase